MTQKLILKRQKHIDPDTILDAEDIAALEHTLRAEKEGTLTPLDDVLKMLEARRVNVRRRAR